MSPDKQEGTAEFDRFRELAERLIKVPKSEIEAERQAKPPAK